MQQRKQAHVNVVSDALVAVVVLVALVAYMLRSKRLSWFPWFPKLLLLLNALLRKIWGGETSLWLYWDETVLCFRPYLQSSSISLLMMSCVLVRTTNHAAGQQCAFLEETKGDGLAGLWFASCGCLWDWWLTHQTPTSNLREGCRRRKKRKKFGL